MAATNDDQQKRTLISILRSLCTSRKDSLSTMQELFRDYKEAEGEDIPFRRFGYASLDKMLIDSGEFTVSRNLSGAILIRAKVSEETQHITRMKAAEKSSSKKRSGGGGFKTAPRRLNTNFNSRQNQSAYTNNYSRMSSTPMRSMPKYNQAANKPRLTYTPSSNTFSYGGNKGGGNGFSRPIPSLVNNNNNYKFKSNYVPEDRSHLPTVTYVGGVDLRKPQTQPSSKPAPAPVKQPETPKQPAEKPKPVEVTKPKALLATPPQRSVSMTNETKTLTVTTSPAKKSPPTNPQKPAMQLPEYRPSPLQNINVTTSSLNNRLIRHTRSYEDNLVVTIPNGDPMPAPVPTIAGRKSVQDRIKRVEPPKQEIRVQLQPIPTPTPPVQRKPVQPAVIVGTEWDVDGITNLEKLVRYCSIHKLKAPEYKSYRSKEKTYQGKVMIRDTSYSTYPMEYVTEHEAYQQAAAVAVEQLRTEEFTTKYPVIMESNFQIAIKLFECLKATSPRGRIRSHVPELFRQHYQLTLPDNWYSHIVLPFEEFFIIEPGSSVEIELIFAGTGPTPNALEVPTVSLTPKLELPWKEPHWSLYVKNPVKTDEIWARLIGPDYNESFDSLMTDIEVSMMTDKKRPTSISEGEIGLVCVADCWFRVRIEKIRSDQTCQCFDIDHGFTEVYPMDMIYVCDPRFLELPAQAVMFTLFGLEDFAENPYSEPHLEKHLNSKVLIAEIISSQEDYDADFNSPHLQPRIKTVLYDTSSDDDINLNKLLLQQIGKDMAEDVPKLDCLQTYNKVVVTHVEESGDIYCQLQGKSTVMMYILKLIHNLVELKFESDEQYRGLYDFKAEDAKKNLYLVRDPIDSKWYRASYISPDVDAHSHKLFYIDYGITRAVKVKDIYCLNLLSLALHEFSGQAFKIRLFDIPEMTPSLLARLRGLLPQNQTALVKILSSSSNIPLVNLFIQSLPQQTLASVNEALRYEKDMESMGDQVSPGKTSPNSLDGNPNSSFSSFSSVSPALSISPVNGAVKQKLDLPRLVDCQLPPLNTFFNVYITVASNPSFFMVQSYDDMPKFNDMMCQLQTYCGSRKEYIPSDMIEVGQAYAGFHANHNAWYRVIVQAIYSTTMINVKFCDIGEVNVLVNDQLKTLPNNFRILPKQALRAKLHGVTPKHIDWTMEDAVRFRELIINKKFVSVIKAIQEDEICANELCASMELIDVSGDEDVYLSKVLIDENRAKLIPDDIMLNSE